MVGAVAGTAAVVSGTAAAGAASGMSTPGLRLGAEVMGAAEDPRSGAPNGAGIAIGAAGGAGTASGMPLSCACAGQPKIRNTTRHAERFLSNNIKRPP